ncbi:hypothetical protein CDAR_574981 [Caerostris darwini]|uniref:Uncharacterized protein n=1 Tax=Caerostris darwini TaxID=1538125 RepID=A0AAV4SZY2_9ARAC|nr:hypothetical protein CDAR_574981 [Caerostris darwini]
MSPLYSTKRTDGRRGRGLRKNKKKNAFIRTTDSEILLCPRPELRMPPEMGPLERETLHVMRWNTQRRPGLHMRVILKNHHIHRP